MSDEDKESKTEDASPQRLQQAFKDGKIPMGRDLLMASTLLSSACFIIFASHSIVNEFLILIQGTANSLGVPSLGFLQLHGARVMGWAIAIALTAAVCATITGIAQTKGGFWPQKLMQLDHLWNMQRLVHIFSTRGLADIGFSLVKVSAIALAGWAVLADAVDLIPALLVTSIEQLLPLASSPLRGAMPAMLVVVGIIAALDAGITHYRFNVDMRMTKEELKREYKEEEGDPHIKSKRKQKHRDMAQGNTQDVQRADALIVNPTHIAIAIRYRRGEDKAPKILVKGKGKRAELMRDLARGAGVPIVQDIPLARLLYKKVKVGKEIPAETYRAVAAVLAFVYRTTGKGAPARRNA